MWSSPLLSLFWFGKVIDSKKLLSLPLPEGLLQDGHFRSRTQPPFHGWLPSAGDGPSCQVFFYLELKVISSLRWLISEFVASKGWGRPRNIVLEWWLCWPAEISGWAKVKEPDTHRGARLSSVFGYLSCVWTQARNTMFSFGWFGLGKKLLHSCLTSVHRQHTLSLKHSQPHVLLLLWTISPFHL